MTHSDTLWSARQNYCTTGGNLRPCVNTINIMKTHTYANSPPFHTDKELKRNVNFTLPFRQPAGCGGNAEKCAMSFVCVCVCISFFFFFFAKWLGRLKTKVFVPLKTICEKYHSPAAHLQWETLWKISFSIKISFAWKLKWNHVVN